ncbi:putative ATPase involved in DNA repair [Acidithiobacillus caldus SM-1]|uniref:ATPase involved in DNA repair n=1 Tax=Acidithiobacillus caldus (strain SM-1) TaxID=990288 RepID=F9ZRX2_ACICS|nr:SMC family ATPase [Acidithiobacillus caldus]AEK58756.1 putative ATPase involved in DNA repair [Acidithiobacillus caldus SM-1]
MKPLKLTLTGFAGIRSGSGKESITLDLQSLVPDDAALVAIVGPNGAGKSTIMDNLHPYRVMPSRNGGSYSPAAFSFYDQLFGDSGSKELTFEHGGVQYRSLLQFQNGKRRKTEAYLFVVDENGESTPASTADGLVSDGKTESYDQVLESVMGSAETFFTSVFSAQNRKPLSSYGNAEIKTLMAELLGLDSIRALGQQAGDVFRLCKAELGRQQEALSQYLLAQEHQEHATRQIQTLEATLQARQAQRAETAQQLRDAEREQAVLQAQLQQSEEARNRKTRLEHRIQELEAREKQLQEQSVQKQDRERQQHAQMVNALRSEIREAQNLLHQDQAEREKLQTLQKKAPAIQAAVAKEQTLRSELEAAQRKLEQAEAGIRRRRAQADALQAELVQLSGTQSRLSTTGENLKRQLQETEQQARRIREVPCAGTELSDRCPLLGDARQAEEKIPPLRISLETLREQYRTAKAERQQKESERQALLAEDPEWQTLKKGLSTLQEQVEALRPLVLEASLLEQAEQHIGQLEVRIQQAETGIRTKTQRITELESHLAEQLNVLERETAEEVHQCVLEKQRLIEEVQAIVVPDTSTYQAMAQKVASLNDRIATVEAQITALQNELVNQKAELQAMTERSRGIAETERLVAALNQELGYWAQLGKALGNDGIIALSIDDVGPTLSGYANDLLLAAYGPRFSLSIHTQVTTAKGDTREGFDIVVFDANTQEGNSVDKMSGGERVWINEAMTRAIALFLAKESGQSYATLFTDEADGALDPDRKRRFMEMKREVLKLGNYEREYFVSQTPELWEMADYKIEITAI